MITQKPTYEFNRKSDNFFDWLGNRIKNVNYHRTSAIIVKTKKNGSKIS